MRPIPDATKYGGLSRPSITVPRTFFRFIAGDEDFKHSKAKSSDTRVVIAAIADDFTWGIADRLSRVEQWPG